MPELSPGSTGRRWIPDGGEKKHRQRIHRDSQFADKYKNLPFSFSKPRRNKRHKDVRCSGCLVVFNTPVNTVGIVCPECKKYCSVEEI